MKVTIDLPDGILEELKEILLKEDNFECKDDDTFLLDTIVGELDVRITAKIVHEMLFDSGWYPSDILSGEIYFPDKEF